MNYYRRVRTDVRNQAEARLRAIREVRDVQNDTNTNTYRITAWRARVQYSPVLCIPPKRRLYALVYLAQDGDVYLKSIR